MATAAVTLAASIGAFGATAYASDYQPATADSRYANVVDARNDLGVAAINLTCSNGQANAQAIAQAQGLDAIGATDADASPILFTNGLDKAITELSVKAPGDVDFSGNVLSQAMQPGDALCWMWKYDGALTDHVNAWGQSFKMTPTYTFKATLADGTQAVLHNVNMNGVRTLAVKHSTDYGVYFVERTTITNHTPDPNLFYEISYAEQGANEETVNQWFNGAAYQGDASSAPAASSPQYTGAAYDSLAARTTLCGVPSENDALRKAYEGLNWNGNGVAWSSTHLLP